MFIFDIKKSNLVEKKVVETDHSGSGAQFKRGGKPDNLSNPALRDTVPKMVEAKVKKAEKNKTGKITNPATVYGDPSTLQFTFSKMPSKPPDALGGLRGETNRETIDNFYRAKELSPESNLSGPEGFIIKAAEAANLALDELLKGKDVVDLGCGRANIISQAKFALSNGANAYVGVDILFPEEGIRPLFEKQSFGKDANVVLFEADVFDFLSKMETTGNEVFMLNGMIVTEEYSTNKKMTGTQMREFDESLAKVLTEKSKPGTLLMGSSSRSLHILSLEHWDITYSGGTVFAVRK